MKTRAENRKLAPVAQRWKDSRKIIGSRPLNLSSSQGFQSPILVRINSNHSGRYRHNFSWSLVDARPCHENPYAAFQALNAENTENFGVFPRTQAIGKLALQVETTDAARRRTHEDVVRMTVALHEMAPWGLGDARGQAADQHFHRAIPEATGNRPLASLAESVGAAVSSTTRFKQRHHALQRDPIVEHRAVHAAIVVQHEESARGIMQDLPRMALADMGLKFS